MNGDYKGNYFIMRGKEWYKIRLTDRNLWPVKGFIENNGLLKVNPIEMEIESGE